MMLVVDNIKKHYGDIQALRGINLQAKAGEVTAVLAKNGAGKSTLLSIIAGLYQADEGEIWIQKLRRSDRRQRKNLQKLIGFAAQDSGLYPTLTVLDNLDYFGRLYGLKTAERRHRIAELCECFHLETLKKRRCNQLSGGEKRRVHAAIALVHRPALLLLDEPTLGADTYARNDILDAVKDIASEGTAVLYTSHYLHEIEMLNAQIVIMDKGQVLHQASQQELQLKFGHNAIDIHFDHALANAAANRLPNAQAITPNHLQVETKNDGLNLADILNKLAEFNSNIQQIERQQSNLEQLFHRLTGHC